MPLNPTVTMTLVSYETVPAPVFPGAGQDTGISVTMTFTCANPGANMPSTYTIVLTSTDISTINAAVGGAAKQAALQAAVIDHLQKQYRPAASIAAVLTGFVGQSVTV